MLTYASPIFGPVKSRRLGISLGVNLMPGDGKVCTFDCIYCECGFNKDYIPHQPRPTRAEVAEALERKLVEMAAEGTAPDVLTFAGNGEPTAHPDFLGIIEDTVGIRNCHFPNAKISVLSNATMLHREDVRRALMLVDNNIQKLDTVDMDYIRLVDQPLQPNYDVSAVIENMKLFKGHCIIQTMFMGEALPCDGAAVEASKFCNTGEEYVGPWLEAVAAIAPEKVMIYTIDRETPDKRLQKAAPEVLDAIRDRVLALGIPCTASY